MKIDTVKITNQIADLESKTATDEKTELLFTIKDNEIVFSGHNWKSNCFYTTGQMVLNNNFKIYIDSYGKPYTSGADVNLTTEDLNTLGNIYKKMIPILFLKQTA